MHTQGPQPTPHLNSSIKAFEIRNEPRHRVTTEITFSLHMEVKFSDFPAGKDKQKPHPKGALSML